MLRVTSIFQGCAILATDGKAGSVNDVLFDARSWKVRWLVVDTGTWLSGRKVLLHPSAIGETDGSLDKLYVNLTKEQICDSPGILHDPSVSLQMASAFPGYDGWDQLWGDQGSPGGSMAYPLVSAELFGGFTASARPRSAPDSDIPDSHIPDSGTPDSGTPDSGTPDPNLRSTSAVTGYHLHGVDGDVGRLQDFLIDDEAWVIRYLIVETGNWLPETHVMLAPSTVVDIDWFSRAIRLNVTREQVSTSPPAWQGGADRSRA